MKMRRLTGVLFGMVLIMSGCAPSSSSEGEQGVTPDVMPGPGQTCKPGAKCDIFGEDDRHELHAFDADTLQYKLARSTAMLALEENVEVRFDGSLRIAPLVTTLGVRRNLCDGERFAEQPVPGMCSGFLVAPDLMMTAGHCFVGRDGSIEQAQRFCEEDLWVLFDYGYDAPSMDPVKELEIIPYEHSYKCKEVVAMRREHACGHDFALFRLDRPVEGREPLALRGAGEIAPGTKLFSIGHPSGLPKKISLNSFVQESYSPLDMYTPDDPIEGFPYNSDEFVGNSGGAVFNAETGVIEGLSSCGSANNDYIENPDDPSCFITGLCGVNTTCEQYGIAYDMPTLIEQLDVELLTELDLVVDAQ